MIKYGYDRFTQLFYLSLCRVPILFLFELSCILHIGTLLLFTVRDYFFLAEGRLLVILLHKSCTNTYFFTVLFLLCGNCFIKAILKAK